MKKVPISLICGASAIIITIILYFTILGNIFLEAIHLITLLCIIIAEILTTGFVYFSKGEPRRVAAAVVAAFMIPFSLFLSIVYIINFPRGYATYIGWYFIALIIINIIAIIIFKFDSNKTDENATFQNAKYNMLYMRKIVKCIMNNPDAKIHLKDLSDIEEKLHFSNDSIIVAQDQEIYNMLIELQNNISNPDFDSLALINNLNKTIEIRNITYKRNI